VDVVRHPLVQEVIRAYDRAELAKLEAQLAREAAAGTPQPAAAAPVGSE
jgi:phosphate starvation-inducible PhoH-like protein